MFIFWWMLKDIVDNQDLYRKKDDLWKNNWTKKFLLFDIKDFIFCKYICKMYKLWNIRFSKKYDLVTFSLSYLQWFIEELRPWKQMFWSGLVVRIESLL